MGRESKKNEASREALKDDIRKFMANKIVKITFVDGTEKEWGVRRLVPSDWGLMIQGENSLIGVPWGAQKYHEIIDVPMEEDPRDDEPINNKKIYN